MNETIEYIVRFLIGSSCTHDVLSMVGYTSIEDAKQYRLIIKDSGFFDDVRYGSMSSLPQFPLPQMKHVPFLYGEPEVTQNGNTLIIHADLIASAYVFLSGYESFVRKEVRDRHGRFPGKESFAFHSGFLHRPLVDEYGKLLRKYMRDAGIPVLEPESHINKVYLTHDIDIPFYYRTWKGIFRGLLVDRNIGAVVRSMHKKENDPAYTYPWILEQDLQLVEKIGASRCQSIFFFKTMGGCNEDKPVYDVSAPDIQQLFDLCKENGVEIGLHTSYFAGIHPERIQQEKTLLEKAAGTTILSNRHHFLAFREIEHLMYLIEAGISDDFSMGYADLAGFRLGTTRPVQWINPADRKLYPLTLHPLTLMERTFDRDYMNFSYEEAVQYALGLIDYTELYGGELVLLWHNTSVGRSTGYYKKLYQFLMETIKIR